jgi:hypothetical protein
MNNCQTGIFVIHSVQSYAHTAFTQYYGVNQAGPCHPMVSTLLLALPSTNS